jgi:hypothetical protein
MNGLLGYIRRNHVGLIALVLALSGTAYAATHVTGKDIKNKSITAKDIKPNALTGKQVKDGGLNGADIADGSLSGDDVADDSLSGADLADGSISGADVADDSLTGADIDEASLNVSRVVARLRDPADHPIARSTGGNTKTSLGQTAAWTQQADEVDEFTGRFTADFPAGCIGGFRVVTISLYRPGASQVPGSPGLVATGTVTAGNTGAVTVSAPIEAGGISGAGLNDPDGFEPGTGVTRKLDLSATAMCDSGSTADPVITDVQIDVLAFR